MLFQVNLAHMTSMKDLLNPFKNNCRNSGDVVELKNRYITMYELYVMKII